MFSGQKHDENTSWSPKNAQKRQKGGPRAGKSDQNAGGQARCPSFSRSNRRHVFRARNLQVQVDGGQNIHAPNERNRRRESQKFAGSSRTQGPWLASSRSATIPSGYGTQDPERRFLTIFENYPPSLKKKSNFQKSAKNVSGDMFGAIWGGGGKKCLFVMYTIYTPKSRISCPGTLLPLQTLFQEPRFTFDLVALRQCSPKRRSTPYGASTTSNASLRPA